MNMRTWTLVALLLLSVATTIASAQTDEQEPPIGWDMGIVSEEGENATFELSHDGKVKVKFWVRNDNVGTAMTFEVEYDLPFDAGVDGPESIDVPQQSNETFEFTVKDVNVASFEAMQIDSFSVQATVTAYGPAPATGGDSNDAEGDLVIPTIVDLAIDIADPTGPMNAGTTTALAVTISNEGNSVDSVHKATGTDSCPLLEMEGLETVEGIAIERGANLTVLVNLTSSSSHPTKNCVVEVSIQSRANHDLGISATADSDEATIQVVEDRGSSGDDGDGDGSSDSSGTDDDDEVVSSNLAPLWTGGAILGLLGAAISRRQE